MHIDSKNLAANFNVISSTLSWKHRIIIVSSSSEHIKAITDQRIENPDTLLFNDQRTLEIHHVDPSASFDAALLFFASRAGTDTNLKWEINCDPRFKQKCPLNWFQLEETKDEQIRQCKICQKPVHLTQDPETARGLQASGACVAFPRPDNNEDYDLGDWETPLTQTDDTFSY